MRHMILEGVVTKLSNKRHLLRILGARRMYSKDAPTWTCNAYEPTPQSVEKLAKDPCDVGQQQCKLKSMWEMPECCQSACPDMVPRFDDLYYQPSDKRMRKYTQTWAECPQLKITPKKICCFDNIIYPKQEKRKRKVVKRSSCPAQPDKKLKLLCKLGFNKKCQRVVMPGCKGSRVPPSCYLIKRPSMCKRKCAPYPSYSECMSPTPKPLPGEECTCLHIPPCIGVKK